MPKLQLKWHEITSRVTKGTINSSAMICAVEVQEEEENFLSSYCDNAYTFERAPGMVFT